MTTEKLKTLHYPCYTPLMISYLRGTLRKEEHVGDAVIDVQGVGYGVSLPANTWMESSEGEQIELFVSTYVREDRLDLFAFKDRATKALFELLIAMNGIGPRLGLDICNVPRGVLMQAVQMEDAGILNEIKGIGKKTAEKLLVELKSLAEKRPDFFEEAGSTQSISGPFDQDAIAALAQLGYTPGDIRSALKNLPESLETTEERVAAALRSL